MTTRNAILSQPILVIDDHRPMLRLVAAQLEGLGFQDVETEQDPAAALARLKRRRYGVILSDWNMAPISGLNLLRSVRADPTNAATPFILVTAEVAPENVLAAKAAGVSGYIAKPFDAAQLKAKLQAVLGAF
ncbi:response regulator [Ferrovibrio sp. MS7]|uniref:response regulator n=1 Tax=Ferrovibrio plantarum TaxID=3119164 RepID=UPI0031362097